jgi:TM2 domain-containing membrane protein YozV
MKKSTKAASLSAFLFPGVGQFYLKKYSKGMLFAAIAFIGFMMIMSAVFGIALSISEDIQLGKIALDSGSIQSLTQQVMAVFQEPSLVNAKIAMIASWLISTIDAWLMGRKMEKADAKI